MIWQDLPNSIKRALLTTIIVSLILGGLVGATAGALFAGWSAGVVSGWVNGGDADNNGNNGKNAEEKTIVEDSASVQVVERASPAVVSIVISQDLSKIYNQTGPLSPFDDFFFSFPDTPPPSGKQEIGGGTGFIATTDGMIVTNRHVVESEDAEYTVILNDGRQYVAQVLARDTLNDLAIIKINEDNLPTLDLGDSDQIKIGQTVIAIGNSLGEFSNTVTKGVISGINRRVVASDNSGSSEVIEEAIQTDAAINPGNSGGPLLDLFSKVIGVNTAVSREGQLIGFAIPINEVKSIIESVQKNGKIVRPFLGVRYILLNEQIAKANSIKDITSGALIVRGDKVTDLAVVPGSPANKAGLVENDIILEVNGEEITQDRSLARILNQYNVGDAVSLKVYHNGNTKEVKVELAERE